MKVAPLLLCTTFLAVAPQVRVHFFSSDSVPVPEAVMVEAQKATQALMDEVVKGNIEMALEQMNPEWKQVEARKYGGVGMLDQKIRDEFANLRTKGIDLRSVQVKRPVVGYEMDVEFQKRLVDGVEQQVGEYQQWMVLVPTVSVVSATNRQVKPPRTYEIRLNSFQVALCEKGKNEWTFIDGSQAKVSELCLLFPVLPQDEERIDFSQRGR